MPTFTGMEFWMYDLSGFIYKSQEFLQADLENVVLETAKEIQREKDASYETEKTILWVDDNPSNNFYERNYLEGKGINIVLALSTEEALKILTQQQFDLIISDMKRLPELQAGYKLLDELRSIGNTTPFIIYAGSSSPKDVTESKQRGSIGYTHDIRELLNTVSSVLN